MSRLSVVRSQVLPTAEQITAVLRHEPLYRLAQLVPDRQPVGRPANQPAYLLLAYGALARVFRSGARVEAELAHPATWQLVRDTVGQVAAINPELVPRLPTSRPPGWDAYRYARNHYLTDPGLLAQLQQVFTEHAVAQARSMGLLDSNGPGSLSHPDRSRCVYGDGTVVRPLYRPPAARRETDPTTGQQRIIYLDAAGDPIAKPAHRFDPDAAEHHGHTGPVHGQNFVGFYVRGDAPHQRVVLAVDRVPAPGREADTAVAVVKRLHAVAGAGIQAVIYDGAMRGVHIEELMTRCGLIVINKVAAQPLTEEEKAARGPGKAPKWYPLGQWQHDTSAGPCVHTLAAVDGAVSEIGLDDAGAPLVLGRLERRQVKRPRRGTGAYHFNVAYEIPCFAGNFFAWITPHGEPGDPDARRAENVRIIAEGEPDFTRLYPLRSDAESFNAHFKRSLLVDRAMSLGGARQLLDVLCYGLVHNAITAHHAARADRAVHLRRAA